MSHYLHKFKKHKNQSLFVNKLQYYIIVYFVVAFPSIIQSQGWPKYDQRGNLTESYSSQGLALYITSSKSRYLTDETISINCQIKNEGLYPITIYLNNEILKNFTFIIRDNKGQSLPLKTDSIKSRSREIKNQTYFGDYTATDYNARAMVIQPGESVTKSFNLSEFLTKDVINSTSNTLNVMAYFYPNPEQSNQLYIPSSNQYSIYIDSGNIYKTNKYYSEHQLAMQELKVSPKEVIYLMLTAEYEKNWLNFFKYLDLKEIIRDYPDQARQYIRAPDDKKNLVIEDFKNYLMGSSHHKLLKFEVVSENIENKNATVKVKAMREVDGFDRDLIYTYYLSERDKLWQISGVDSQLAK
ncbi:MAG: hypothetical protein OEV78_01230 [Spirochaetia bacterium]|nr:hypothetical protein [Spirochaetia bacterium]